MCSISVSSLWLAALQESAGWRERVCRGVGQPGGLSWLLAAAAWLLQGHLGLPVLPRHRQLPVLLTEGERKDNKSQILCVWNFVSFFFFWGGEFAYLSLFLCGYLFIHSFFLSQERAA